MQINDVYKKLKSREIDQIIVRVGKKCNFQCLFCNIGENEKEIKDQFTNIELVKEFFKQLKKTPNGKKEILVSISGGEPTLFKKNVVFIVKFISKYFSSQGIKTYFELQTNGTSFPIDFGKELVSYGLIHILLSFHTHDSQTYKRLIGVDFEVAYKKITQSIKNIEALSIEVSFNIVLNKLNYITSPCTIEFLCNNFPYIKDYNIGFFQPNGYGEQNFDDLNVETDELMPYYIKDIQILESKNKNILSHFTGVPICLLGDYKKYSLEYQNNIELRKIKSSNFFINTYNNINKRFLEGCRLCKYRQVCSGVWINFGNGFKIEPEEYKFFDSQTVHFGIECEGQVFLNSDDLLLKENIQNNVFLGIPCITLVIQSDNLHLEKNDLQMSNIQIFSKKAPINTDYIIKNLDYFLSKNVSICIFDEDGIIERELEKKYNGFHIFGIGKNA